MSRVFGPRRLSFLRTSVMLAFALGLFWQSMLGSLGEIHEAVEHASTAATHEAGVESHEAPAHGNPADDGLHLALHYAHCCGQAAGLADPGITCAAVAPQSVQPRTLASVRTPASHLSGPFRPPIRA
ncbi:hypothetical protein MNQ95_04320 [Pseudoxanthomonas daejeonensis]|uniref:DUF2946 domain-containing protein n=1 Tax=Pseudoxanthomonas daejeonensis TaxID=266062 RepID=A0ABQ6Z3F8_9GAMM|nr:hypothetical protein [Pseudoxanthomonas daejeonensis]KAF1692067.1 hypothetical protein CSC65_15105 [Pseudoxanthomonas daejeonensis]UNK58333.1 hypothetical protein MNQ95_04320 [Pseudoxanthomonas daejeonensis]